MRRDRCEILQGTPDLMIPRSLQSMGPLHGWGDCAPDRTGRRRFTFLQSGHGLSGTGLAAAGQRGE